MVVKVRTGVETVDCRRVLSVMVVVVEVAVMDW